MGKRRSRKRDGKLYMLGRKGERDLTLEEDGEGRGKGGNGGGGEGEGVGFEI